ncbi:signal transduction histidine kinase [Desulfitispora alkaliphila]|uniref:hypothetical protein n=1 Tax=Desulfitispora alkaliphila TaxID=622674 RepID=UPI003D1AF23A
MTLISIGIFILASVLIGLLVPKERIIRFLPFGLWAGLGLGLIMLYIMVVLLGTWQFAPGSLVIAGMPLGLALIWVPLEIGYAHFFPRSNSLWVFAGYIVALPLLAGIFHAVALMFGYLQYNNWSVTSTVLVSVLIHGFLAYYLYKYQYNHSLNSL